jgi:hypothetical protein
MRQIIVWNDLMSPVKPLVVAGSPVGLLVRIDTVHIPAADVSRGLAENWEGMQCCE